MKPTMMMFIDSNNFYKNVADIYLGNKIKLKWTKMILGIRDEIQQLIDCYFSKAYYFSALSNRNDNPAVYDAHKKFLDNLNKCSYVEVVTGNLIKVPAQEGIEINPAIPSTYRHIEKNTDINMASEMLISSADIVVVLSADSDFDSTIERIKKSGKKVILVNPVGSKNSQLVHRVGREDSILLDKNFFDKYVIESTYTHDDITTESVTPT